MIGFDVGETVICALEAKREGDYIDLDSAVITIYDFDNTAIVSDEAMTRNDTGRYQYDFDSTDKQKGAYRVKVIGTYGGRITITWGGFKLV